jgi:hypothetical protein
MKQVKQPEKATTRKMIMQIGQDTMEKKHLTNAKNLEDKTAHDKLQNKNNFRTEIM